MARRKVRDRLNFGMMGAIVLRCECGKRLGLADHSDGVGLRPNQIDMAWFNWNGATHGTIHAGSKPRATHGIKHLAYEDWISVRCPACGRDWQGRERHVAGLIRRARALGVGDATLV